MGKLRTDVDEMTGRGIGIRLGGDGLGTSGKALSHQIAYDPCDMMRGKDLPGS